MQLYNLLKIKIKRGISSAFTMAEAVLVMTILGIIATIMIATLKPAEFKERGLRVLADKVMAEIDTATTQILLNNSRDGTFENLIAVDGTNFGVGNELGGSDLTIQSSQLAGLYKKYLATTRQACSDDACSCYELGTSQSQTSHYTYLFIKDGACIGILASSGQGNKSGFVFPGEDYNIVKDSKLLRTGTIIFDINGSNESNTLGKDQFRIPLGMYGIMYDST